MSITPASAAPKRRSFTLSGPSPRLDPARHAVRGDLADVRLADRVFAPHYVAHIACRITRPTALRSAKASDSDVVAPLAAGDAFELLDITGGVAWGIAGAERLVGYVDAAAIAGHAPAA